MVLIPSRFVGDLWDEPDYQALRTAFLGEHLATSTANPHAETINLGDGTTNSNRTINANRLGGARYVRWNESAGRWEINNGAGAVPMLGGVANLAIVLIPTYPGEVSAFTSSAVISTFEEEFDGANFHNALKLDNRDDATQTAQTNIRFRMPPSTPSGGRVATIRIWNRRVGTDADTFLGVQLFDTSNASVSLSGVGALTSSGWTETVCTVTAGTYAAGGYVTLRLLFSAAPGEQVYSGEIAITLADS